MKKTFHFFYFVPLLAVLSGCGLTKPAPKGPFYSIQQSSLQKGEVLLYLSKSEKARYETVSSFFQANMVMVTHLRSAGDTSGRYWAIYPSVNSGPSPLYTHHIEVEVQKEFPLSLAEIIKKKRKAVLVSSTGFTGWRLIGYASAPEGEKPFNWYADRQDLLLAK